MKADELIVGDYVLVDIDMAGEWVAGKVFSVSCHRCSVEVEEKYCPVALYLTFDRVAPMPITRELLEKNGFRNTGGGDGSMMLLAPFNEPGLRYNIYVGLKYKTINVYSAFPNRLKNGRWRKHNNVDMEVSGPYVHELQHAFRLCGIEIEINL